MIHIIGQNYNAKEIVQNIFSPLIGIVTSNYADEICHRNNLTFAELLQPFARLQNDAQFRDALGTSVSIRGLRLNFCNVDWRPPQTVLARKMLNESVTNAANDKSTIFKVQDVTLELPSVEPWFEQWRETFLNVQFPADHEFTRHFLSCLIILSSGDPSVVETAQKLSQHVHLMQSVTPQKLPKWFHSVDVLNSYVLLHEENQDDLSRAQHSYELLKSTFGDSKCFLIQINSLNAKMPNEIPDYWAPFIKRQPKAGEYSSGNISSDQLSGTKTPQDSGVGAFVMPNIQIPTLNDTFNESFESAIPHPLSPVQEHATEAINSKFSISNESISSQNINPNVWSGETDNEGRHGQCLNAMDVENIRHFVQDYAVRALIPYIENLVVALNEAVTNKKGVSKSLLSATKRWFVTSKPGSNASNQNTVIYTQESTELQTRKLGDLYFMFCHYNMAFQAYHQAKRDFNADSAWQYYAGALEMAALSAFMLGTANRKTYDYMEDAIVCYLNVCKLQQFATRATLLSVECLKMARLYGEAAKQLLRMTSEESDLRSALLVEQAAYCFLFVTPSAMHRKYAFQMVLAGNRYSRAGQRKHAYRCYSQAYQVFRQRGWSLAEDHIQYTRAKQACMLKKLEEASNSFAHLLRPCSLQNSQQQLIFLKEYLHTQNEYIKHTPELSLLPLAIPQVVQESIRVLTLTPTAPSVINANTIGASNVDIHSDIRDESIWHKIEEMLVTTALSNRPLIFKPLRSLFTKETPTSEQPLGIQGEPIVVAVMLTNTIGSGIHLKNVDLIWRLKLDNNEELSNICLYENGAENPNKAAVKAAIKSGTPQEIELAERAQQTLNFQLIPKLTGLLSLVGMVAQVNSVAEPVNALLGSLQFETQTFRAPGKQAQQLLLDQKLNIRVVTSLPSLSVSFSAIPSTLIAGEVLPVTITLRNEGCKPINELFLSSDNPRWLAVQDKEPYIPLSLLSSIKDLANEKLVKDKEIRRQHVFRLLKAKTSDYLSLQAQESTSMLTWLQAPYVKGEFILRLMFYYSLPSDSNGHLKYRLVRHAWTFQIHECVTTEATCVISNHATGELGLNIDVRHVNSQHQPTTTGATELYINSLALSCDHLKLNPEKFYILNQMETTAGTLGDYCLKPSKCINFQCRLKKRSKYSTKPSREQCILKDRLSYVMDVMSIRDPITEHNLPKLHALYSFLANHETVYFSNNITTEEFNKQLTNYEACTTLAVCWSAFITHSSIRRVAHGQHFIQMKFIYERYTCPVNMELSPSDLLNTRMKRRLAISHFGADNVGDVLNLVKTLTKTTETQNDSDDDIDSCWEEEPNDSYIGQRCILEDDTISLSIKV